MSLALKNKMWQPTASIDNLKKRADIIQRIRQFFIDRNIFEVDTPLICRSTATDPYIHSLKTKVRHCPNTFYLQTSPEFPMKRLLAAGSGSIFQLGKVFRDDEQGRYHNPEFTMLEWYRPGFNHHQLMDEMDELLQLILDSQPAIRMCYRDLFLKNLNIDPFTISLDELKNCAQQLQIDTQLDEQDDHIDTWLMLLLTHCIEPKLGLEKPVFIFDYPASQSALAKIRDDNPPVAERFEVYFKGIELANGYHELTDATEQKKRMIKDNKKRQQLGHEQLPMAEKLIAALNNGMPKCAGVALGVDRLVMLACDAKHIEEVIPFTIGVI